jgi:hypothetical protein
VVTGVLGLVLCASGACDDDGEPVLDGGQEAPDAARVDAGGDVSAGGDAPASDGPGGADLQEVDATPLPPGKVTGTLVNDTADDFRYPDGIRFRISVEGAPTIKTQAVWKSDRFSYELDEVPGGPQTLVVAELDAEGNDTLDLYQAATRRIVVDVAPNGTTAADFHLRWHWEPHKIDAGGAIRSCDGLVQMAFSSLNDGMVVFNEPDGDGNIAGPHGSVMVTRDGGKTWTVATKQMAPTPHALSTGNWFGTRPLLILPDGQTALSAATWGPKLSDGDQAPHLLRTMDGGQHWTVVPFAPPVWGTVGISYGGLARSGSDLFVGAHTGGVQGSSDRDSLSVSRDGGATWQVLLDRCDRNEANESCAAPNRPNLPLGFAGLDIGCGPAGHCIVVGSMAALATTDGFATHTSFSILPTGYGCSHLTSSARVYWIPGTSTAWVVAPASGCGFPPPMRRVTIDGGATFGDWEPSPVSAAGDLVFADANHGFALEVRTVRVTHDGGKTWRSTGPAPHERGSNAGLRLSVVDAEHAFVSNVATYGCSQQTHSWLGRWVP